ncbi:MAG: hypothetical protein IPK35_17950 [Saprospiraceae bacterium]|nr:hypothetical protein [Saprospiraceae bacterium]
MNNTSIQKYKDFCHINEDQIPIFFQPYWLDILCHRGQWNVILNFSTKDTINGILVYYTTKKYGQSIITNPPLTPHTGIILLENNELQDSTKIIENLISKLPKITYFTQSCLPDYNQWLPIFWQGFNQTSRITYTIENIKQWHQNMCSSQTQRKLNKGKTLFIFKESENIKDIYHFSEKLWLSKNIDPPIEEKQFIQLDKQLALKNKRKLLVALDYNNVVQSAVYLVFDQNIAYSLLIGSDPFNRNNYGAVHYLLAQAIKFSSQYVDNFDFEGSMIKGLAHLYSSFGARPKHYHRIYKAKNIFWDIAYRIKSYYDKSNR